MRSDCDIKKEVSSQIQLHPLFEATHMDVEVKEGVVKLSGSVENYFKKLNAEKTAKKIAGVIKVVNNLRVCISRGYEATDREIEKSVVEALRLYTFLTPGKIKIKVKDGVITLDGVVESDFEREAVNLAIVGLPGVRHIYNFIETQPKGLVRDINKSKQFNPKQQDESHVFD